MSKTRIRRPASDTRPARRSLVELTGAASRAIDDGLLVTSASLIAVSPNDPPGSEPAAKTHNRTMVAEQVTARIAVAMPEPLNAAAHNGELVDSDSTAEMVMKIAEDYHVRAFETIKLALNAALDRAKFRAEALELIKANVITTLEYAQDLAGTTTAAEFVELSGTQARKQCELILKQAGSLTSLAQTITKSMAD
jgi:phasin protein